MPVIGHPGTHSLSTAMQYGKQLLLFLVFVACAAAFVRLTGQGLPDLVASHFDASGIANGFMPRTVYIRLMLALLIGLPALTVFITWAAIGNPKARINLPDREYWLAPERRAETVAFLRGGVMWFGVLLVSFLCYAHWLVVRANEAHPVRLDEQWFFGGLAVFLVVTLIWLTMLLGHFRSRS